MYREKLSAHLKDLRENDKIKDVSPTLTTDIKCSHQRKEIQIANTHEYQHKGAQ